MKKITAITLAGFIMAIVSSPVWAKDGNGGGHGSGEHGQNAATPAVPAEDTGSRATPADPGNLKAEANVDEHRKGANHPHTAHHKKPKKNTEEEENETK